MTAANPPAAPETSADVATYEAVFERYLEICNRALAENKDKFPFKEIWRAHWQQLGNANILQCAVYDDRPKVIYTLELTPDMTIRVLEKTHVTSPHVWPFKYSYLKHVVDNPQEYIDQPAKLDWGWLSIMVV